MFYTNRFLAVASSVLAVAGLTACAPMPPSGQASPYPAVSAPRSNTQGTQGAFTEFGRISNVEVVRLQQPIASSGPGLGAVLGGVAGAVVGNQIGSGGGRTGATVIGAVGGAVAGNAIERSQAANAPASEGYRITVQLDNGSLRSFDLPLSYGDLRINDRVRIDNGQLSRAM